MRILVHVGSLAAWLGLALAAPAATPVAPGMSPEEVIARLGQPDRIAVFDGKYLKDVPLEAAEGHRFLMIYRATDLRVWFDDGKASAVEEGAGPAANPTTPAPLD